MKNSIRKLKQLDLDLVFYMAFVKLTKQLLMCVHLLDLDCLQLGHTYKIATFLESILSCLTLNELTVKDTFSLAKEIFEQDCSFYMGSLDVDSLFSNIALEETINICTESIYDQNDSVEGLNKSEFKELLSLATKESYFIFNQFLYKQIDGVAMGSPLGPTLANAFFCFYEKKRLEQCPEEVKPVYYRRYVDNHFLLFRSLRSS